MGARPEEIEAQKAQIRALEASRDAASDQLEYTVLRAPFSGQIARTAVENFQMVQAKQPILSLQDTSKVELVADIPENVAASTTEEKVDKLEASFDFAPGRLFPIEYTEAELEADARTSTYAVTFLMDAPDPEDVKILPGMSATVHVTLKQGASSSVGWLLPADAVFADDGGGSQVWRVGPDMRVKRTTVRTGELSGDSITVLEGLSAGDTIVTAGVRLLSDGQQVRLLSESAE